MTGTCPFRKKCVFACYVCQSLLNLFIYRRIYQIKKREEGTECVPKTSVGVEVAIANLPVVWTVMDRFSISINLVELAREKRCSV